jgi:hypothetical protein
LSSLSESLIEISWNCFVTSITFRPFTIRGSAGASAPSSFEAAFRNKGGQRERLPRRNFAILN